MVTCCAGCQWLCCQWGTWDRQGGMRPFDFSQASSCPGARVVRGGGGGMKSAGASCRRRRERTREVLPTGQPAPLSLVQLLIQAPAGAHAQGPACMFVSSLPPPSARALRVQLGGGCLLGGSPLDGLSRGEQRCFGWRTRQGAEPGDGAERRGRVAATLRGRLLGGRAVQDRHNTSLIWDHHFGLSAQPLPGGDPQLLCGAMATYPSPCGGARPTAPRLGRATISSPPGLCVRCMWWLLARPLVGSE